MKIVNLILAVIFLVSCGSGQMLDGKSKMTSFRFEDSFIQNTNLNFPLIGYSDLLGISNGAIDWILRPKVYHLFHSIVYQRFTPKFTTLRDFMEAYFTPKFTTWV